MADLPELPAAAACFLDFDGTLVEIASHPDAVEVPVGLVGVLGRLDAVLGGSVAVVTGRRIADIDRLLAPLSLPVAGVHGAERRGRDGQWVRLEHDLGPAAEWLRAWVTAHPGSWLEEKPGALAVHYRGADALEIPVRIAVGEAQASLTGVPTTVIHGKKVSELRPAAIDKGRVVREFLSTAPFSGRCPWYFGDDRTDEDAFEAVEALGGVAVKVGPGPTRASRRIADPPTLLGWLRSQLGQLDPPGRG